MPPDFRQLTDDDIESLFELVVYYQNKYSFLNQFPLNSDRVTDALAEAEFNVLIEKAGWLID